MKFKQILLLAFLFFPIFSFAQTRAVWVRPFINADFETRKNPLKARESIRRELEKFKLAKLNTVYLESFWDGYTIYPSKFAAQRPLSIAYGVARKDEAGQTETYDVLQIWIDEAAKVDIKIHPWFHVFHQWSTNLGGLDKSPIFKQFPEWAMLDKSGSPLVVSEAEGEKRDIFKVFMSPSNPSVRKFLRQIVGEIAEKYPKLGGIQWDYIRYPLQFPESPFDYNPLTLAQFTKETKLDATKLDAKETPKEWRIWQDWKTKQVTEVVAELAGIIRKKRPEWQISAAVFPGLEENLKVKQQDWKTWSDLGLVDVLLPMVYSRDYKKVENWTKDFRQLVNPKVKVAPALFIPHFYDDKAQTFDEKYLGLVEKYKLDGFGLFASQYLNDGLIEKMVKK